MKVLFTAAGSIGSRHITNLSSICMKRGIHLEIDVLRKTNRLLPDNIKKLVRKEIRDDCDLDELYDLLFITDETGNHYNSICKYGKLAPNMFVEKPIFEKSDYDITPIMEKTVNKVIYVAAPIRFTKYYATIKKIVENNKIYSARVIFSDYMPNWQKGRDYRKSFRCFKIRGGGVDADSIHELDYIIDLFGFPKEAFGMSGHYSHLEMDACDLATYMFRYEDKIVEIHLDYFGKKRNRCIELYTENDVVIVNFDDACCVWKAAGKVEKYGPDNHFYEDEMTYFLDLVSRNKNIKNINPVERALKVLNIAKNN